MVWPVRALRLDERRAACDVLTGALLDDPAWVFAVADRERRRVALRAVVDTALADAREHARVVERDGTPAGVAVWQPPGRYPMTAWRKARAVPRLLPLVRLGGEDSGAVRRLGDGLDAWFPASPVRYLQALGVDPGSQGKGIGTALLAEGLLTAAREDADVYLETGSEANVGYYEGHGFRLLEPGRPVHTDGPVMWRMRRTDP